MIRKLASLALTAALVLSAAAIVEAAPKKKPKKVSVRDGLTQEQKKELRRRGREWCLKNHAKGNAQIDRVEILSNGYIRCWYRG